uniref:Proteasome subunit beta type-3 n=1 Tax=Panagrolaimus superbus TaxID=310955 RepID=A0A914YYS7_9BILA
MDTTNESVESKVTDESMEPKLTDESMEPKLTDEPVEPKLTDVPVEPKLSNESGEPKLPDESVEPKLTDESVEHKFKDYYDLPVKRMVFGDVNFPVLNEILRIKENNVCLRIVYAQPPEGTKPDRRHCLQIQLSFSHIHKFMFLAPESSNGATAIALAISDVAVLRINGALFSATGEKPAGHPSRRYIFFDLLVNHNNPTDRAFWEEVLRYISYGYNVQTHKRLTEEKKVLSEKDYLELEKNLKVPYIGFIKKETMIDLLKFSDIVMEVIQDKKHGLDYIIFVSAFEQLVKVAEKRKEPNQITISDTSIPKLDKHDIIQQESASGRIEFNSNDLALLNPNAWLNDKIVDWYCYHLLKLVPEEKQKRIRLCETHFYTSITKGIENETNPTRLKAGIYQNYDPKKFKHSFFESDFIVVPIHRLNHWFLVVIIDPKAAVCLAEPSQASEESAPGETPHCHFLIFDSFKKLATNEHDITFDHLTYFLARHYDDVKSNLAASDIFNRGLVDKVFPKDMPQQTNADDCGVYSLMFLKYFFDHLPDGALLPDFSEWWKTFTISGMRSKIYNEIITTAINYEAIKQRHQNDDIAKEQQPPAKKPKIQMHPNQQIYRISVPTNFVRPTGVSPITFRPRTPNVPRLPTVSAPVRGAQTAKRGRGSSTAPRKPAPAKRGPRKAAAQKVEETTPADPLPVEVIPPPPQLEQESNLKEPSANESLNATYESMGLQASDDENLFSFVHTLFNLAIMSIMSYTGGTVLAMAGDGCVCIATDLRMGEQMTTIATDVKKIHKIGDRIYVGLCGFYSDALTVKNQILYRKSLYELRENRKMRPQVAAEMISNMLYNKRFGGYITEPLVAGLDPLTNKPYICAMDTIGCIASPRDFVAVGTGQEYFLGVCEGFWRENMGPDELFEATAQSMLSAMERDAASGWGVLVYTITKDKINVTTLKARMD